MSYIEPLKDNKGGEIQSWNFPQDTFGSPRWEDITLQKLARAVALLIESNNYNEKYLNNLSERLGKVEAPIKALEDLNK